MSKDKYVTIEGTLVKVPQKKSRNYNALADFIIKEEGFLSKPTNIGDGKITLGSGLTDPKWHKLYKLRGNVWSEQDNRRAVIEEIKNREQWLQENFPNWSSLNPSSQNALISYKYNYNFTPANSPKLFNAARRKDYYGIAMQMDATSKDPKFRKGLMERRKREQDMFLSGVRPVITSSAYYTEQPDALKVVTPYPTMVTNTEIVPQMVPDGYVGAHKLTPSEDRINKFQESMEAYKRFNTLMDAISLPNNPAPQYNPKAPYVISTHADGGFLQPQDAWDALPMAEKAEMMKVAVKRGIYNLQDIRAKYNEFAEGGEKAPIEYTHERFPVTQNFKVYPVFDPKFTPSDALAEAYSYIHLTQLPEVTVYGSKHSIGGPLVDTAMNEYKIGGSIHIKPSHRGRLTELKARTGKSETELYNDGNPAHKKMVVFARSARKWKHGEGGPLVDWIMENKYALGGDTNPMNYEHRGTIYSDELKNQGITHVAELPEVVVTGRDLRKPYVSAYDNEAIIPFIQLADPTGITNIPNFVMDLKEDEIDWRRTALDAVSILPYFKYGKAARNGLRSFGKVGEVLSWIPTILSKGEKKGIELINKGYNKILNRSTDFVDNIRSYLDYGKGIARLSPAEATTRGFSSLLMHYSGGHPQGIHQGPVHTLFGDNTYYTGFFKANPETDISGNFSVKDKDAISQYYYGNSNLTPYTGNKITINGKEWDYPHFNENILPVDKGDTLELTPSLQPIIEDAIQNNKFIGLNTNSLKRMSPDREGTTMLNGRNVNTKPFKDNNGQYYLKAFDNFDFSGTVPLGTGADSYVENTRFLYPNSGPFVIVQDSIPVTFKTGGRDAAMFNDMRNSYGEYILQGQFEDN